MSGTSYYALWKSRLERQQKRSKYASPEQKPVPGTAHASTAAILSHVVAGSKTQTETGNDLKPEAGKSSTDEDEVWTSAATSPTAAGVPLTSSTGDGNPVTSSTDGNTRDGDDRPTDGESAVNAFAERRDSVTSFSAVKQSPNTTGNDAYVDSPVTSFVHNGDPVTSLIDEYFPDIKRLASSAGNAAKGSPLTSFAASENFVTSYNNSAIAQFYDGYYVTGSSYPETGSDVTKLVLVAEDVDRPKILHRIRIPIDGEVLAEMGVTRQSPMGEATSADDRSLERCDAEFRGQPEFVKEATPGRLESSETTGDAQTYDLLLQPVTYDVSCCYF